MSATCKNGHDLTRDGARIWTGDHWQCQKCRLRSQERANARYDMTANGILRKVRYDAGRRGL